MMYGDKGLESEKMAKICYKEECYNSCVNRYYYSFYQQLLQKLEDKDKLKNVKSLEGGSHDTTFYVYINDVVKKSRKYKWGEESNIDSLFRTIKAARKKADYRKDKITEKQAKGIAKTYTKLIEYLELY